MRPRPFHSAANRVFALVMIAIGVALLIRTVAAGGGALATGVILGVLFLLAGVGRLYVERRMR